MIIAIALALIGLALVFMEFYLPGGVVGVLGGLIALSSIAYLVWDNSSATEVILFTVCLTVAFAGLLKFALYRIQTKMALKGTQEGYNSGAFDEQFLEKKGVVLTSLRPSGYVEIDGNKLAAVSRGPFLEKGTRVIVTGGRGSYLVVTKEA